MFGHQIGDKAACLARLQGNSSQKRLSRIASGKLDQIEFA
jgi:hypothetical protein